MRDQAIEESAMRSRIALEGLKPPPIKGEEGKQVFGNWYIKLAMKDIYDMFERTGVRFMILGDVGREIKNRRDDGEFSHIEIAMPAKSLVPEIKSLFKTWGFEETKYGYKYYFTPPIEWKIRIPVEIHVISRRYDFFVNPDIGFYGVDEFYIPNPFDKYWKARHLVR